MKTDRKNGKTAPEQGSSKLKGKGCAMRERTHCPQGHEYNHANTWINSHGHRVCRACKRVKGNRARDPDRIAADRAAEQAANLRIERMMQLASVKGRAA